MNPGDTVRISCTFDNSQKNQPYLNGEQQKPRYIVWGESTGEEMCLSFIQATIKWFTWELGIQFMTVKQQQSRRKLGYPS